MTEPNEREVLAALYRAADLYQASVRPQLLISDDPLAQRIFERNKKLQLELLEALKAANDILNPDWRTRLMGGKAGGD